MLSTFRMFIQYILDKNTTSIRREGEEGARP